MQPPNVLQKRVLVELVDATIKYYNELREKHPKRWRKSTPNKIQKKEMIDENMNSVYELMMTVVKIDGEPQKG